ncbi:hypothetical protein BDZ91DRAFT_536921 [Kalaharituber pfeilii]|nr:hypothetical protein BDZ91DRAFT_536921 [Kalaharituber pfeilii]
MRCVSHFLWHVCGCDASSKVRPFPKSPEGGKVMQSAQTGSGKAPRVFPGDPKTRREQEGGKRLPSPRMSKAPLEY